MHTVDFRERVGQWRDGILSYLEDRGTQASCDEIRRIKDELPHLTWLRGTLARAEERMRLVTWSPPSIEELRELAQSRERRIVQSPEQLLDVVLESLDRLGKWLQRMERPAVIDLWNECDVMEPGAKTRRAFRPKDEDALSNYVARHLELDLKHSGVIVNREVEIRKSQRNDIRVNVSRLDDSRAGQGPITVVIESKGCWNRDLDKAMEEQLVGRYLDEFGTRHGIYLVGWFQCEKWDNAHYQKKASPQYSIEEARARFAEEAKSLSIGGKQIRACVLDTSLP
jgi:hypothetical protein